MVVVQVVVVVVVVVVVAVETAAALGTIRFNTVYCTVHTTPNGALRHAVHGL